MVGELLDIESEVENKTPIVLMVVMKNPFDKTFGIVLQSMLANSEQHELAKRLIEQVCGS